MSYFSLLLNLFALGAVLGILQATDPENQEIEYSIQDTIYFGVDSASGRVSLLRSLDREVSLEDRYKCILLEYAFCNRPDSLQCILRVGSYIQRILFYHQYFRTWIQFC